VEASCVRLRSEGPSVAETGTFTQGFDGDGELNDPVPFVVPSGKGIEHVLELAWPDGRREVDRDTEIAIDIFCEHLGDALELLNAPGINGRGSAALSARQRGNR
jgi:hypothetical protein